MGGGEVFDVPIEQEGYMASDQWNISMGNLTVKMEIIWIQKELGKILFLFWKKSII